MIRRANLRHLTLLINDNDGNVSLANLSSLVSPQSKLVKFGLIGSFVINMSNAHLEQLFNWNPQQEEKYNQNFKLREIMTTI